MNEVDRSLGLALLKRLWQRGLVSEETFIAASNSRYFNRNRFPYYAETDDPDPVKGDRAHDDN